MTLALNLKEASEEYSCLCVFPTVVSKSSAHMAPEVQNYSHTKCRAVKELFPTAWAGRNRYCRLLQELVVNGFLAVRLVFFLDMAWFASSATVNSQNYQYWCSEKPSAVH